MELFRFAFLRTNRVGGHFESMGGGVDVTIYCIKDYANYDTCI